jgi:hypothetical protein
MQASPSYAFGDAGPADDGLSQYPILNEDPAGTAQIIFTRTITYFPLIWSSTG